MTSATLRIDPGPRPGDRIVQVDCTHGRTQVALLQPNDGPHCPDTEIIPAVLQVHEDAEHCGCTRHLMDRFGRVV